MSRLAMHHATIVALITVLLFGTAIGATGVSAQSADGEVAVSPTDVSLEQGDSETIAVTYERLSNATPQGIEYTLAYDSDVITVTDQKQGSYLGGRALVNNISTPGEVEYLEAIFDGEGVETTNGTIATITVEAASDIDHETTTSLEFTTAKASEGSTEFTITTTNGTVKAEVPTQEEGSTDTDSNSEETTDEDSNSEETTDEDSDNEETTDEDSDSEETTGENADTEETTDDTENNGTRTEDVGNSTSENENRTEAELNETADTETSSSTTSEQPANDSSTGNSTTPEDDTSGAIPGFGIKLTLIAVLAISYIIGRKSY